MKKELVKKSKFLSLVLRHDPAASGLHLDAEGWCEVSALLQGSQTAGIPISLDELIEIVKTNEKKRFMLDDGAKRIRANQGHSVKVDLGLTKKVPPSVLYHGTTTRFMDSIQSEGLKKMKRHHVHLSSDIETAKKVGMRHGKVLILRVDSDRMCHDGYSFYLSENNVWLVDEVPPHYLEKMD